MSNTFSCPTCGAPLTYKEGDAATILCPFCRNSVIVPEELRHAPPPKDARRAVDELLLQQIRNMLARNQKIQAIQLLRQGFRIGLKEAKDVVDQVEAGQRTSLSDLTTLSPSSPIPFIPPPKAASEAKRSSTAWIAAVIALGLLVVGAGVFLIFLFSSPEASPAPPTATPSPTPAPTLSPTPQFASLASTLGSEGIGAGKFTQANSLALDPDGFLYVGDYEGNRIQVFDPSGKFIVQWNLDPQFHIRHLAAGRHGELYAIQSGRIFIYDRKTGRQTGELRYQDSRDGDIDDFDNMVVGLDGSLLTSWINNTLETDTLLRFDSSGKLVQTLDKPISGLTGEFEAHIYLALDGLGNIYALGEINHTICVYSPQGKLISRFGSKGDNPGQFSYAENIAIDSRGRLYIGEYLKVHVYDTSGLYLDTFETAGGAFSMVFDSKDNLYLLDTKKVMKYALNR